MDEMHDYEIPFFSDCLDISQRQELIRMRWQIWATLKPYLKKKRTKPEDIFTLPWDKTNENKIITEKNYSDKDITNIKKMFMALNEKESK